MNKLRCFFFADHSGDLYSDIGIGRRNSRVQAKALGPDSDTNCVNNHPSTSDGLTQPTSAQEIQIVWQDPLTMLVEILLTTLKMALGYN